MEKTSSKYGDNTAGQMGERKWELDQKVFNIIIKINN